jgi:hypothetical protein
MLFPLLVTQEPSYSNDWTLTMLYANTYKNIGLINNVSRFQASWCWINDWMASLQTLYIAYVTKINVAPKSFKKHLIEQVIFIHSSVICQTTGPQPLPKRFLHLMRSRASSKWEYPLLSPRSSSNFLRLLPRLLVTSMSIKCVFWYSQQLVSETFLILRGSQRDIVINVKSLHVKYSLLLSDFNET